MVDAKKEQQALKESLAVLEEALESPIVPGEATDWATAVQKALADLTPKLHERINKTHADQLEEIGDQDGGLLTRVQELHEEDEAILADLTTLEERVAVVAGGVEKAEPNEVKAEPAIEWITKHGLDLVIRIRKQELAIETWLVEAFQRDRGVAD